MDEEKRIWIEQQIEKTTQLLPIETPNKNEERIKELQREMLLQFLPERKKTDADSPQTPRA